MKGNKINKIIATVVFLLSLGVYLDTVAPTVSFWDCGEFIACSYRMAVPHPPGAPLFLLVGRVFTLIPDFLIDDVAARMNLISVLSSAFTVLFLYLTIVHLIREYLKSEEGFTKYIPYAGAFIGAMCFTFTHSFWFNAVEAEVYAPSMLFTGLVVWLIFFWSERSNQIGNEKYILLIAYLIGLAIGVHLLNVLALPMVLMIIYYRHFKVNLNTFAYLAVIGIALTALIYPGIVKGIPWMADTVGFAGIIVAIIALVFLFAWAVNNKHQIASLLVMSILLIIIGYSSYLMIYIRSNLDPNIDENDPETVPEFISYMNREQYGEHTFDRELQWQRSPNGDRYSSASEFFWEYQVWHMYVRYFFWNFGGIAEDGVNFDLSKFWGIPLLLGLIGAYYHFLRDWKHGLAVFVLFFMTGLAIILYLNQPDPQPRERDYSYVGSFFAFSIWIGIGAAAILEWVTEQTQNIKGGAAKAFPVLVTGMLVLLGPVKMMAENYHTHDRTGNYVASDYSYNMLVNCETNGIMFTNGDNDTFPLWYLQEVDQVRTDVRVANLSLLNTPWYIEQLKHKEPKVPISYSDEQIENIELKIWPKERKFEIPIRYEKVRNLETQRYNSLNLSSDSVVADQKLSFKIKPKYQVPTRGGGRVGALRVQDLMILNILSTNQFRKPVYFAVTTSRQNQLDELQKYLRMDGLVFKVTTIPGWEIDPEILYDNLMNKFRYRNLNNPDVYFNDNIIGLVQNYRSAFFRLAHHYLLNDERERFDEVIQKLSEKMPPEVIPFTNRQFEQVLTGFGILAGVYPLDTLNTQNFSLPELQSYGQMAESYGGAELIKAAYGEVLKQIEANPGSPQVEQLVQSAFRRAEFYQQASEEQKSSILNRLTDRMRRRLIDAYKDLEEYDNAIGLIEKQLEENPENEFYSNKLEEIKKLKAEQDKDS